MSALPPSSSYPIAQRLSPGGIPFNSYLILVASDTGLAYRVQIAGSPPAFTFQAIPDVADIRRDFATVALLRATVPSVASLRTWGF